MRVYIFMAVCLICGGCAGGAQQATFAPVDPSTVIVSDELLPGAILLQRVTTELCYDPFDARPATREVLNALKGEAAAVGGNRLRHISYRRTGLLGRCAAGGGIMATAVTYRVE